MHSVPILGIMHRVERRRKKSHLARILRHDARTHFQPLDYSVNSSRTITTVPISDAPGDSVVAAVRDALSESHGVLGELGRGRNDERAFLLSVRGESRLEIALLTAADQQDAMDLTLLDQLDARIPASEVPCPFCERRLRVWGRYCTRCGKDLSGVSATSVGLTPSEMLAQVREIAGDSYEVLGAIPRHEGGGEVYFARASGTSRLVALRLEAQPGTAPADRHYTLGVSAMVREVAATPLPPSSATSRPALREVSTLSGTAPIDLLAALREQAAGEYEVFGEMGQIDPALFFLARELASGDLVALRLVPATGGYSLDVHRRLDRRLNAEGSICAGCGCRLDRETERCNRCGRRLSSGGRTAGERDNERSRLRQLSDATNGDYEFIGEMERANDDSAVYFARRASDRKIVGLRCERSKSFGDEDAIGIRETGIVRALEDRAIQGPRPDPVPASRGEADRFAHDLPPAPDSRRQPAMGQVHRPSPSPVTDTGGNGPLALRLILGVLGVLILIAAVRSCN